MHALNATPYELSIFVRELAGASSLTSSLDTAPSVPSRLIPTVSKCSSTARPMVHCPGSPSSGTCARSTVAPGTAASTSVQLDFLASLFPLPGASAEPPTRVTSGPISSGWFARYDPGTSSWKTPQVSLLTHSSECFSGTWPPQAMMRSGVCWAQTILAHRITAKGSGYSPTTDGFVKRFMARHLPAALAPTMGLTEQPVRVETQRTWSTPRESDWRSGKVSVQTLSKNTRPLSEQVGGLVNPPWTEWLMAWPDGWTALKPLGAGKFRLWRQQLGVYSQDTSERDTEE